MIEGGKGRQVIALDVDVVRTPADAPLHKRLLTISDAVEHWMDTHHPDVIAIERVFSQQNVSTVMGTPSYLINDKNDIRTEWLEGAKRVGVTAGASTPEFLVTEVGEALQRERQAEVREVHVVEEDVRFGLPRELEDIARQTGKTLPPRSGAPVSQ